MEEVKELKRRFEDHLEDYRTQTIEDVARKVRDDERYTQTMHSIDCLAKSTKDVVDAWTFANTVQKFVKWLSGFAILGGIITYLSKVLPS